MMMMVYFGYIFFFAEQGSWRADGAVREAFSENKILVMYWEGFEMRVCDGVRDFMLWRGIELKSGRHKS